MSRCVCGHGVHHHSDRGDCSEVVDDILGRRRCPCVGFLDLLGEARLRAGGATERDLLAMRLSFGAQWAREGKRADSLLEYWAYVGPEGEIVLHDARRHGWAETMRMLVVPPPRLFGPSPAEARIAYREYHLRRFVGPPGMAFLSDEGLQSALQRLYRRG